MNRRCFRLSRRCIPVACRVASTRYSIHFKVDYQLHPHGGDADGGDADGGDAHGGDDDDSLDHHLHPHLHQI